MSLNRSIRTPKRLLLLVNKYSETTLLELDIICLVVNKFKQPIILMLILLETPAGAEFATAC